MVNFLHTSLKFCILLKKFQYFPRFQNEDSIEKLSLCQKFYTSKEFHTCSKFPYLFEAFPYFRSFQNEDSIENSYFLQKFYTSKEFHTCSKFPYLFKGFDTCSQLFHTFLAFKTRIVHNRNFSACFKMSIFSKHFILSSCSKYLERGFGISSRCMSWPSHFWQIMANSLFMNVEGQNLQDACTHLEQNQNCTDHIIAEELAYEAFRRAGDLHDILINSDYTSAGNNGPMMELETVVGHLYNFRRSKYEFFKNISLRQVNQRDRGRPKIAVSLSQVSRLRELGFSWSKIAKLIGVGDRTPLRRRQESGQEHLLHGISEISNERLDDVVSEITLRAPDAGERMIIGAVRARGIRVQRWRMREAINRVDPIGKMLRSEQRTIARRVYSVPCPNALWYVHEI